MGIIKSLIGYSIFIHLRIYFIKNLDINLKISDNFDDTTAFYPKYYLGANVMKLPF